MEFVLIPAGSFQMGTDCIPKATPNCDESETPPQIVQIKEPFYMGKYEITQKQWYAIMRTNPVYFNSEKIGSSTENHPVESVTWNDAQEFIKKLNEKEGTNKYRLPIEAEWEYAARAGSSGKWSFGDNENDLKDYAWYGANSDSKTHPVGQKKPNGFGLHDMHGNVWEWTCSDYEKYSENNHLKCSSKNDANKSLRGGSWSSLADYCRSADRSSGAPDYRDYYYGFRVVSVFSL